MCFKLLQRTQNFVPIVKRILQAPPKYRLGQKKPLNTPKTLTFCDYLKLTQNQSSPKVHPTLINPPICGYSSAG